MFVGFDMVAGFRSLWPWLTLPLVLAPADPARSSCPPPSSRPYRKLRKVGSTKKPR